MADVKWIKLASDIFDNRKIKVIETMPDGYAIIVVWLKLLCLAGNVNDSGMIYLTREIPYTEQMIAAQFNMPITTVQLALATFERFGMIERLDDIIFVSNWEKYQNSEKLSSIREYDRVRKQKYREKQKSLSVVPGQNWDNDGTTSGLVPNVRSIDIDKEEDIELDIEKDIDKEIELDIDRKIDKDRELDIEKEKEKEKEREVKNKSPLYSPQGERFADFWKAYPKKVGKGAAEKSFQQIRPDQQTFDRMMMAISVQKRSDQWRRNNGQYIPNPATWLNQRRWEDELTQEEGDTDNVFLQMLREEGRHDEE